MAENDNQQQQQSDQEQADRDNRLIDAINGLRDDVKALTRTMQEAKSPSTGQSDSTLLATISGRVVAIEDTVTMMKTAIEDLVQALGGVAQHQDGGG